MLIILLVAVFSLFYAYWFLATRRPKNYPPGPKWLPIVGNALELKRAAKKYGGQHEVFKHWKEKYNSPVIGIKLGRELVVVALTYPIVYEVHTNKVFDGRPDSFFLRLRTMGSRLGITFTDGKFWSEQRNFVSKHLRRAGYGRQPMDEQIQCELNQLLKVIDEQDEKPIWPGTFLPPSVLNVLWMFTAGSKISRKDGRLTRLLTLMQQRSRAFDISGGLLNSMPFLRYIAPEKTSYNLIKRFNVELRDLLKTVIDEHKCDFSEDKATDDLIYAFLNEMKSSNSSQSSNFTDIQLTMVILDLFIAGALSTSNTLDFALIMMIHHPKIQLRCHTDIDRVLNEAQLPTLKDKSKLAYIEAVILETQRFFNIVPTSGPRRVMEATTIGGYYLPKNTTVLIGLESVSMDKEYWTDPEVFRPERFLDSDNKITNTERLVVFGQGKRRCLGEALARACLFSFFVGILQKYRLEAPQPGELPSTKPQPGIINSAKPYKVIFRKR